MICVYVGRAKTVEPIDMQFVLWTRVRVHEPCHRLRGSASTVLTVTGFVNGKGQYLTPQNPHSLIDHQNLLQVITWVTPVAVPNLVEIRPREASGQMGEI